jgi:hypothetical protein
MRAKPKKEYQRARAEAFEHVADIVAGALRRAKLGRAGKTVYKIKGKVCERGLYQGQAEISRRVGRDMRRTLYVIQAGEQDCTISTLSDIAAATGHRLQISMVPITDEAVDLQEVA